MHTCCACFRTKIIMRKENLANEVHHVQIVSVRKGTCELCFYVSQFYSKNCMKCINLTTNFNEEIFLSYNKRKFFLKRY